MTRPKLPDPEPEDVCPGEWRVMGYSRPSHSMFHPAMHECGREWGHKGRCVCRFCQATHKMEEVL